MRITMMLICFLGFVGFVYAGSAPDENTGLVREIPKTIESFLVTDLGLSSTGNIEAIGQYRLTEGGKLGKKGDKIIHVVQKDLNGERLFWTCLINVDRERIQVLYRCQNPDEYGTVLSIKGE